MNAFLFVRNKSTPLFIREDCRLGLIRVRSSYLRKENRTSFDTIVFVIHTLLIDSILMLPTNLSLRQSSKIFFFFFYFLFLHGLCVS